MEISNFIDDIISIINFDKLTNFENTRQHYIRFVLKNLFDRKIDILKIIFCIRKNPKCRGYANYGRKPSLIRIYVNKCLENGDIQLVLTLVHELAHIYQGINGEWLFAQKINNYKLLEINANLITIFFIYKNNLNKEIKYCDGLIDLLQIIHKRTFIKKMFKFGCSKDQINRFLIDVELFIKQLELEQ